MSPKVLLLMLLSQFSEVTSQLLLKKSTNDLEFGNLRGLASYLRFFKDVLSKKTVWVGFLFAMAGILFWLIVLAYLALNFAFPFESLIYVWIMIGSGIFLKERINLSRIIGTLLIVVGVLIVALS